MSSNIEQILKIYNVKPKKARKPRKGKSVMRDPKPREVKRMHSLERVGDPSPDTKKRMKSLEPNLPRRYDEGRALSLKSLPGVSTLNTSLEESFERLEKLMCKSNQARTSRLNLQVQMLKLGVSELAQGGSLGVIEELEDMHADEVVNQRKGEWTPVDGLATRYETEGKRGSKEI